MQITIYIFAVIGILVFIKLIKNISFWLKNELKSYRYVKSTKAFREIKINKTVPQITTKTITPLSFSQNKISNNLQQKEIELSIIMLTHNALDYTKKAISSIKQNTKCCYELIVIDNFSTDGTQTWLSEQKFDKLILNKINKGVAGGRNQGIELAKGKYICFLDNDIEVGLNWDEEVFKTFTYGVEHKQRIGIVGAKGEEVPCLNPLQFAENKNKESAFGIWEVDVVPGFCFIFTRELLLKIGNQYEGLGVFWHEDLEFCLRAKLAGYRVYANTMIPIIHYEHKSADSTKNLTNEEIKAKNPGFEEKAANIGKRLRSDNVLTIYRNIHPYCHESYCLLAKQIVREMRKKEMVVVLKNDIFTPPVSFNHCKGFEMNYNGNRFILAHQENDRPPKDWIQTFEKIDYAFCVSTHVYDVLVKAKIPKQKLINVSPNGIDSSVFNFNITPLKNSFLNNSENKFTFLTVGAAQPRKGTDLMIEAFCKTFTKVDNVRLVIKNSGYGQKSWVEDLIKKYSTNSSPEIIQIYEDWSSSFLAQVYKTVALNGAYIHAHRAEAFGLPIYEALACGCRVGTTGWGGVKYNLTQYSTMVTLFNCKLTPSTFHNHPREPFYTENENPLWATPSKAHIIEWMKNIYSTNYNSIEAKKTANIIVTEYSFEKRLTEFHKALLTYGKETKYAKITY